MTRLVALKCNNCSAQLDIDEDAPTYTCQYCNTVHARDEPVPRTPTAETLCIMAERAIARDDYEKALQFTEQGLLIDPHHAALLALDDKARAAQEQLEAEDEAEECARRALGMLDEVRAYYKSFPKDKELPGTYPARVGYAVRDIDHALELCPNSPVYLATKALLLWEGQNKRDEALVLLERAAALDPSNAIIQEHIKAAKASACFIATAAYGTPFAAEIDILRTWRDQRLARSIAGRQFIAAYYRLSPPVARLISGQPALKWATRQLLAPVVRIAAKFQ